MLIDLTEDTLADLISQNEKLSYNILLLVRCVASWEPKFKKLANRKRSHYFCTCGCRKCAWIWKLANVSNLPTFATLLMELVNETQTNKQEVLIELVNEIV
jgi:hypothetical protein